MAPETFAHLVEEHLTKCTDLLLIKGGEYAGDGDRLANFRRGAAAVGVEPLTVALVYASKHYDAISTYVRDCQTGRDRVRAEAIEGRFHDLINYCLLMLAIISEEGAK